MTCVVCGDTFEPRARTGGGLNRKHCYSPACMRERERRERARRSKRHGMPGRGACAVCGKPRHVGLVCAEASE